MKTLLSPARLLVLAAAATLFVSAPSKAEAGIAGKTYDVDCLFIVFNPFDIDEVGGTFTFNPDGTTNFSNVTYTEQDFGFVSLVNITIVDFFGPGTGPLNAFGVQVGAQLFFVGVNSSGVLICQGTQVGGTSAQSSGAFQIGH